MKYGTPSPLNEFLTIPVGYLHLAYFATEITLHRQILRSLSPPTNVDPYLLHICRSAAKTRLISAMDFVNRLKPEHLQSFWYFASKVNFALIGTFGSLLWATSPSTQEAEFYKARLSEYRWTLRVSSRGADFMEYAVGVLDASAGHPQQEQFKKKNLENTTPGYASTVGAGEGFGLGMGVGMSVGEIQNPSLLASQWRAQVIQHQRGHLSPITYDEYSCDDLEEDEGGETDRSSTSTRRTREQTGSQSPSMKAFQGFPFHHIDNPFPHNDPMATNCSTPTSTTSSVMDFFMIPNSMQSRNDIISAVGGGGGELDFLATTAGWHSSRRDGDD